MRDCWLADPDERPPFTEISERLEQLVEEWADDDSLLSQKKNNIVINRGYASDLPPDDSR